MNRSTFVYVTYIRTTQERLWTALTEDTAFMEQYWFGVRCLSEWRAGSPWKMDHGGGKISDEGRIVEIEPPRRLVIRWRHLLDPQAAAEGDSLCTMELEPFGSAIKLTVTHTSEHEHSRLIEKVSSGWPKVLANLKSLLEAGTVTLAEAYPAGR
jgi:uncharacterized protein YndB with AHSA1/START domain